MPYSHSVPDNIQQAFNHFQQRLADLENSGFVKKTGKVTLRLFPMDLSEPIEGLDRDYIRSFLITLRQFTLNQDPIHIFKICNHFRQHCHDENLRKWVAYARDLWQQTMKSKPIVFKLNDNDYDVEDTLDLFLYGGLVHSNLDKTKELENLSAGCRQFMTLSLMHAFGGLIHSLTLISACLDHFKNSTEMAAPVFGD